MLLQQFFDAGLGHASYLVADPDAGVAFLVDPDRAIDAYLAAASKLDVLITHSFETHVHNDYLSGSRALAELRPITVVAGPDAQLEYPHTTLRDEETIDIGALRVRCVVTPGHTPEHVAFLVSDLRRADDPQYLFSGGALLVGHIARVDLLGPELEERLARDAYATLRDKVLSLADYVAVFPTHGGGSACSGAVAGSRWTTLGFERRHNDIARAAALDFREFHETIARGLPVAPAYYPHVRALNHRGVTLPDRRPLPLLSDPLPPGASLLDPRPPHLYGAGHRRGALNIVGNDGFAVRCGAVVAYGTPIVLLTRDEEQAERLRAQLSLIGFDDVRGYAEPVAASDDATATIQQLDARTAGRLAHDGATLVDVRERSEYALVMSPAHNTSPTSSSSSASVRCRARERSSCTARAACVRVSRRAFSNGMASRRRTSVVDSALGGTRDCLSRMHLSGTLVTGTPLNDSLPAPASGGQHPFKRAPSWENGVMRIAFVASSVPRRCGIATFTADLSAAVKSADPAVRIFAAAINEPGAARAYGPDVRWRIHQEEPATYRDAAIAISASNVDIVNVQHEFGLYGVWHDGTYDDHLRVFLENCTKPVVTTLHTVAPRPEPWALDTLRYISEHSEQVVVMGTTAARLLREFYGVARPPVVIEHGMPAIEPKGRHRLKRQLGVEDRPIVSTFGLVDPRKGIEFVIEAMPEIVARHPKALYLVVGQTHPELQKRDGEAYRNSLIVSAARLGLRDHVKFVNQYLTQREVVDYLLATDVYVTPYLDPNQITSGTLAYALGAGKAIVSTPYLHAQEVLDRGRGILVPFRDAPAIATAVNSVLGDPQRKRELELRAYEYGRQMAWPAIGRRVLAMMRDVLDHRAGAQAVAPIAPAIAPREPEQEEQLHEEPTPIA